MRKSRPVSILVLILTGTLLMTGWNLLINRYNIDTSESRIWVEGTSTIHDWSCDFEEFAGHLEAGPAAAALEDLSGGNFVALSRQLDCDSGRMDRNARAALNVEAHPQIRYQIESVEVTPAENGSYDVVATGQLTIAGTERAIELQAQGTPVADGRLRVTGSTPLQMTDFGVDPPTAMLGTLKTHDRVTVHFDVVAAIAR